MAGRKAGRKVIYIGRVAYGPEVRHLPVDHAVTAILDALKRELADVELGSSVDVVVHIPGSLGGPDFQGIRTGRLSRRKGMVQAEVAIPREVAVSDDPLSLTWSLIAGAIRAAADHLDRAGLAFDRVAVWQALRSTSYKLGTSMAGSNIAPGQEAAEPHGYVAVAMRFDPRLRGRPFEIEDALRHIVEGREVGYLEGNEVGRGEHTAFFFGPDLRNLQRVIKASLADLPVRVADFDDMEIRVHVVAPETE